MSKDPFLLCTLMLPVRCICSCQARNPEKGEWAGVGLIFLLSDVASGIFIEKR